MRVRWAVTLTAALAVVLIGAAGAASATDPVHLESGYVLDEVGALSATQSAEVDTRMSELYTSTGVDLYVVLVDQFTNPSGSQAWADAVAQDNGLGTDQYLLAIATDSRQYYISADSAGPMSNPQLDEIEADIKPQLSAGDYAGAAIAAADGFEAALGGAGGSGGGISPLLIVLVVVAAGVVVWLVVRSRRKKAALPAGADASGAPPVDLDELARQASSALIATDDAVKTSEQELGFARAQFGDAATVEFEQALARAKDDLNQAFTLKQQLDDGEEDSAEEIRDWNTRILQLCEEANTGLDEKAEAFDELRQQIGRAHV